MPTDKMAPWTIKSISTETRDAVVRAAQRENLTVGQWIEKRVGEWLADGSPVPVASAAGLDVAGMEAAARAMALIAQHSGRPIPGRTAASFYALIGGAVRQARRLPRSETKADPYIGSETESDT